MHDGRLSTTLDDRRPERVSQRRLQLLLFAHDDAVRQLRHPVYIRSSACGRPRHVAELGVISGLYHRHLDHCRTGACDHTLTAGQLRLLVGLVVGQYVCVYLPAKNNISITLPLSASIK